MTNTLDCPTCGRKLVPGGAYTTHVRACGNAKRRRTKYREVFFAHNGPGPYPCAFCESVVDFEGVVIHHDDHDHTNDEPGNLVPCHQDCHTRHHFKYNWTEPEFRKKMQASPTRGHHTPHTEEAKAKMGLANIGRAPWNKGMKTK